MVVLTQSCNKLYRLDGAVSKLRYAAFHLVPYHSRTTAFIPIEDLLSPEDLLAFTNNAVDAGGEDA